MKHWKWVVLFISLCSFGFSQKTIAYSGGNGTSGSPYLISTKAHLMQLAADMADVNNYGQDLHYKLTADIDLAGTIYDEAIISPLSSGIGFYATLDGDGHAIKNLRIHAGATGVGGYPYNTYLGLIGTIAGGTVQNLGVENFTVTRDALSARILSSGAICGIFSGGTITNCYSTGSIDAGVDASGIGGLCGSFANSGDTLLIDSHSTVSIFGDDGANYLGGLCGVVHEQGSVEKCNATGSIISGSTNLFLGGICGANWGHVSESYTESEIQCGEWSSGVGGLCGFNFGVIANSYSHGNVSGEYFSLSFGGFCGENDASGTLSNSYSHGDVSGGELSTDFGGFCGENLGVIANSYSHGDVSGGQFSSNFGGFCGENDASGSLSSSYSKGTLSSSGFVLDFGGFCGGPVLDTGTSSNCFWDTQTSGRSTSTSGTGKSTTKMMTESTFVSVGWDFTALWEMDGYPVFKESDPFAAWLDTWGVPVHLRGDTDTPAGDGVPNILKFASDLPAMQPASTSNLMSGEISSDGVFSMLYFKSKTASGVTLEPIWAASLTNTWQAVGIVDELISSDGEREERKASIPVGESGFMRLRATRIP